MTQTIATQRSSEQTADKNAIRPFHVNVPEAELTDLRQRLAQTRLPDKETVTDYSQGVPLKTVQQVLSYWQRDYDWRKVEARIRLAAFNGHLTQDVKFGLGLLGHLDKGGHFEVRQAEVVPGHWDMTTMSLEMTGKALLFKSIGVQKRENRRDFHRVSDDLTLTQAADILYRHRVVVDNR